MKSILMAILRGIGSFFAVIWRGFVAVLKACFIDLPIGWIIIGAGAIILTFVCWVVPSSNHEEWQKCAAFCRAADCYAGPETNVTSNICECYRLSDHVKVWISTKDGDRMVEDVRQTKNRAR